MFSLLLFFVIKLCFELMLLYYNSHHNIVYQHLYISVLEQDGFIAVISYCLLLAMVLRVC